MVTTRAVWVTAVMSPKPTVAKILTVKYNASVRVNDLVNVPGWALPIRKYVEANSSKNSGTAAAKA